MLILILIDNCNKISTTNYICISTRHQLYDVTNSARPVRASYQTNSQLIQTCQCGKIKHCIWNTCLLYIVSERRAHPPHLPVIQNWPMQQHELQFLKGYTNEYECNFVRPLSLNSTEFPLKMKDWGLTKLQSNLFEVRLEKFIFLLWLFWALNN